MINKLSKTVFGLLRLFGVDITTMWASLSGLPRFLGDYRRFKTQLKENDHGFPIRRILPILNEHSKDAGVASGMYFHQDLHVARRVFKNNPKRHIDVGSLVAGFVAHVAAFREIEVVDIRQLRTSASNIKFVQADLQDSRSLEQIGTSDSVSCLNALEHFGLGRYGDPIEIDGYLKGVINLANMVEVDGLLYLSVPIGPQRVEFNAHRVFDAATLPDILAPEFSLERFSYVDDDGEFHDGIEFRADSRTDNFGCNFGCGIYELRRLGPSPEVLKAN